MRALVFIDVSLSEILQNIVPEATRRVRVTAIVYTHVGFAVGVDDETFHEGPTHIVAVDWVPEHVSAVANSLFWRRASRLEEFPNFLSIVPVYIAFSHQCKIRLIIITRPHML